MKKIRIKIELTMREHASTLVVLYDALERLKSNIEEAQHFGWEDDVSINKKELKRVRALIRLYESYT